MQTRKYKFWCHTNRKTKQTLWYWHRASKGRIVSDSGQGYATKRGVLRAIAGDAGGLPYVVEELLMQGKAPMQVWFRHNISS